MKKIAWLISIFLFLGFASPTSAMIQGFQRTEEFGNIGNNLIRKLFDSAIPFLREVQTSVPTTDSLPEGWGCFYNSGTEQRVYFNVEGTLLYFSSGVAGLAHTQNTDTALGAQTENLDMNSHKVISLSAPASNGDAIRQTTKITEASLEDADDKKHTQNTDTDLGTLADDIDFGNHQGLGFMIENRTDDTGCTQTGRIWFRTDL